MTSRRRAGMRLPAALLLGLLSLALIPLGGCVGTPATDALLSAPPAGLPVTAELTDTPFFPRTDFYCGPATIAAALEATGVEATPDGVAAQVFTPGRQGSFQADMITAARRNGRLAIPVDGMTASLREVAAGRPVLILQNLSLEIAPQWHYALLVGYDLAEGDAFLRSGTERRQVLPLTTLEHTWRRSGFWGIVLAPPEGPVPAAASPETWLAEAAGLERAGRRPDAVAAFRTAVAQWPQQAAPRIALANGLYGEGDLAGAERALRAALAVEAEHAVALNNLAHLLLQLGRLEEAERLARRAVAQGGRHREAAARTLAEIQARRPG